MSQHVLLLGGHGKIAQLLTPLLLKRSWTVTSVIRAKEQVPTIEALGKGTPGKLNVLLSNIEDVDSQDKADKILKEANPTYVVFAAGAGGKGPAERTFKVDRDAATHFINAAAGIPSITRFLLISYLGSRRQSASWWASGEWDKFNKEVNEGVLANYYKAKIVADEVLYKAGQSGKLTTVGLRPGTLTEEKAGKVTLGKTKISENVSRESVAKVTDELLAADELTTSWIDLTDGEEEISSAVQRVVTEGVDTSEGEPVRSS
ncbi:uncharacterized protein J7T54_007605 [Emericellopsis cladophorae]|uniref:NAD(P)-binding domain-containing protein n=1 Tax=Emericellopsis cladophorae TaxID=2686198 RepID=A0A9Q0BAF5_9HYPO|nr:uncharacterized protein J7T54_007605 [Emericellopsis cladophorae]KAI6777711.1 hypothetical protein J7T54_007605 [Emericellopsis cladophorae]